VDVGVARVDSLDGGGAVSSGDFSDELPEDVPPVDELADRAPDLLAKFSGDVSPAVRLAVSVGRRFFHDRGDLRCDHFFFLVRERVPGRVVVERVQVTHSVLIPFLLLLLDLVLQFLVVPFGRLVLGEVGDELCDGHRRFFFLRPFPALGWRREDPGHETTAGKCHVVVTGDDRVDREVGRHVPHLRRGLAAGGEMTEDEVVEFMRENSSHLRVGHRGEELRVPVEGDVIELRIVGDRGGWDSVRGDFSNVSAQFREEGRVLEERDEMSIQVEVRVN